MMEKMRKIYSSCANGLLENDIFAYHFGYEKICRCSSCMERKGENEIRQEELKREEEIQKITFDDLPSVMEHAFDSAFHCYDEEACYYLEEDDNGEIKFIYRDGRPDAAMYCITALSNSKYLFEFIPWCQYFMRDDALYAELIEAGYEFVSDTGIPINKTKLEKWNTREPNSRFCICEVCGNIVEGEYSFFMCCPYCGRTIISRPAF